MDKGTDNVEGLYYISRENLAEMLLKTDKEQKTLRGLINKYLKTLPGNERRPARHVLLGFFQWHGDLP